MHDNMFFGRIKRSARVHSKFTIIGLSPIIFSGTQQSEEQKINTINKNSVLVSDFVCISLFVSVPWNSAANPNVQHMLRKIYDKPKLSIL